MFAQLEVIDGADKGRVFPLSPGIPLVIGRGRQTVTRLNDLHVSRAHCQVEFHEAGVVIRDLNSVGGTLVNDRTIAEHILQPGDIIQLGETKLRFQCADIADLNTLPPDVPAAPRLDKRPTTGIRAIPFAIPIPDNQPDARPFANAARSPSSF